MAKADDKIPTWMPFAEALERAGALEALLPVLIAGDATARAEAFLVGGYPIKADRNIPSTWWDNETAYDVDPAAGRATFSMDGFAMTAIGIEIEAAPITARWPAEAVPDQAPSQIPAQLVSPTVWFAKACKDHPRQPSESQTAYADRLHRRMRQAPVTKIWELSTLLRRLKD
jgi:hypothetical protein